MTSFEHLPFLLPSHLSSSRPIRFSPSPASRYSSRHRSPGSRPRISPASSPVPPVLQSLVLSWDWDQESAFLCPRPRDPFHPEASWYMWIDLLARSAFLARLGDYISAFIHGDFAIVARARGGGTDFDCAAGEFVRDACVDAGFGGWERGVSWVGRRVKVCGESFLLESAVLTPCLAWWELRSRSACRAMAMGSWPS